MKLRKYTVDTLAPLPFVPKESTRGGLDIGDGAIRLGIEIVVDSITLDELAKLGEGWELWEGEWPEGISSISVRRKAAIKALTARGPAANENSGKELRERVALLEERFALIEEILGI